VVNPALHAQPLLVPQKLEFNFTYFITTNANGPFILFALENGFQTPSDVCESDLGIEIAFLFSIINETGDCWHGDLFPLSQNFLRNNEFYEKLKIGLIFDDFFNSDFLDIVF